MEPGWESPNDKAQSVLKDSFRALSTQLLIERRVGVHNSGKGAKYTRARLPVSLVYIEQCESLSAALKRERQLKPWSRAKKEALVAGDLALLKRL